MNTFLRILGLVKWSLATAPLLYVKESEVFRARKTTSVPDFRPLSTSI